MYKHAVYDIGRVTARWLRRLVEGSVNIPQQCPLEYDKST